MNSDNRTADLSIIVVVSEENGENKLRIFGPYRNRSIAEKQTSDLKYFLPDLDAAVYPLEKYDGDVRQFLDAEKPCLPHSSKN